MHDEEAKYFLGDYKKIPSLKILKEQVTALRAVLFDMDGTLIDSEPLHAVAFLRALSHFGVKMPAGITQHELVERYKGMADVEVVLKLKQEGILDSTLSSSEVLDKKHHELLSILQKGALNLHPEMLKLLAELENENILFGIVTASERQVLDVVADILGLRTRMHVLVGRQDTSQTKPHPMPYLHAMNLLGVESHETIILEDSNTGLQSARASKTRHIKASWF